MQNSLRPARASAFVWTVVAAAIALAWNYPSLLTVVTSLKGEAEILASPFGLPKALTLDAYRAAWDALSYGTLFWNSLLYATAGSALAVALAIVPAVAFAWYPIPGRALLFVILLTTIMLPQQAVIIPLFTLLRILHLLDTRLGLIIVHAAYGMPFLLLILTGFVGSIPRELEAAARIDGCSDFAIVRYIVLPLAGPAIAVGFTLNFIEVWKEYFFALVLLSSGDILPVNVGILAVTSDLYFTSMNVPSAAVILAQLPIIILFVFAYRWITQGLYVGSVKG